MPLKMLTGIRKKIIEKYKDETERKKTVILFTFYIVYLFK
jgi:hypothetical protein